jgi:hypothetical protein
LCKNLLRKSNGIKKYRKLCYNEFTIQLFKECEKMWTAIYVAEGYDIAKKIENLLNEEGFLVKINTFSKEGDNTLYEILAPEFEAQEVQSFLVDLGII